MGSTGSTQYTTRSKVLASSLLGMAAIVVALWIFGDSTSALAGLGVMTVPILIAGHLAYKAHLRALESNSEKIAEAGRIHLATVEVLATAIDARDQVGIGHARRTQIFAEGLGRLLGVSEAEIDALRTGALLHDIGKLAVPDHILNKPGRLTPAEVEKTKTHSNVGALILEKVGFPYPVVPTVKYHHESWDGSGYPEGLKGTAIPQTARILAVADAFDTMRGARTYRPPLARDEACRRLRASAGIQFDPSIVDIFLQNLRSFEERIENEGLGFDQDTAERENQTNSADAAGPAYVDQIKRANHEAFTLYSLAREFSGAVDLDQTLTLLTQKIREFVPFDTCVVYLLDEGGDMATAVFADSRNSSLLEGRRIRKGEGPTGTVLQTGKAVSNLEPQSDFTADQAELAASHTAMISIPLIADDGLIGAVALYSDELAGYQHEHLRLLETTTKIAADAISKSRLHAETESIALTDLMTGLPNARSVQLHFEREVKRASRNGTTFQVMVLDLDGFKAVNDTHGHKTGDRMLREIAGVIRGQLRDYDFLARYGGDEFVAIIPETDNSGVSELTRRIEDAVKGFVLTVGEATFARVGVSIGSAAYPTYGETFDQIMASADKAMYSTKAVHKTRAAGQGRPEPRLLAAAAVAASPWDPSQPGIVEGFCSDDPPLVIEFDEEMNVELDESSIVSSAAVN